MAEINPEKSGTSPLENGDKTRFYFEKLINLEHSLSTIVAVNIAIMVIYVLYFASRALKHLIMK